MLVQRALPMVACSLLCACPSDEPGFADAGRAEAGVDAGHQDAGMLDAGDPDAGVADSGAVDAGPPATGLAWRVPLPHGSFGSPRLVQGSGGPQLLIGIGNELAGNLPADAVGGSAFAFDVNDGAALWRVRTNEELFAVPLPMTPRPGSQAPYLFAGRNGALVAVDAERGEAVWRFEPSGAEARAQGLYNFYGGAEVPDQNGDGVPELVVPNGGDHRAAPQQGRPPGFLMAIDGATGAVRHRMQLPDDLETYCSLTLWPRPEGTMVVFGTGGEAHAGSLWGVPLNNVLAGNLEQAQVLLAPVADHGFIGPPAYVDLDGDQILDLVASPYDGRVVVLSGATLNPLWRYVPVDDVETHASVSIGDFDGDGDLDVFSNTMPGTFPMWTGAQFRAFDGRTGDVIFEQSIAGQFAMASSLAADVDNDGRDEVLFTQVQMGRGFETAVSKFMVLHVDEQRVETLLETARLSASTGWVGDADGDGYMEWISTLIGDGVGELLRINLPGRRPARIAWGGYLGTQHNGHY